MTTEDFVASALGAAAGTYLMVMILRAIASKKDRKRKDYSK